MAFDKKSLEGIMGNDFSKPMASEPAAKEKNPMDMFEESEDETKGEEKMEEGAEPIEHALMSIGYEVSPDQLLKIKEILGEGKDLGGAATTDMEEGEEIGSPTPVSKPASKLGKLFAK